jgi:hypothetical protein
MLDALLLLQQGRESGQRLQLPAASCRQPGASAANAHLRSILSTSALLRPALRLSRLCRLPIPLARLSVGGLAKVFDATH